MGQADAGENSAATAGPVSESRRQAGWAALTDWRNQPTLSQAQTQVFSSHERPDSGPFPFFDVGNKDFNNFLSICGERPELLLPYQDGEAPCLPGQEGFLIAAADGPGYVSRIALAAGEYDPASQIPSGLTVDTRPASEVIRIYVDDEPEPVYEGRWLDWIEGVEAPFAEPLTTWASGLLVSYVPISYRTQLRIYIDGLRPGLVYYYYNVVTHQGVETQVFDPEALRDERARDELAQLEAMAAGDRSGDLWAQAEANIASGETQVLWQREQAGTLQQLMIEVDGTQAEAALADLSLRVRWDDGSEPALDLSLADLFGARPRAAEFDTWPMRVQRVGSRLQCYLRLPMPFRQRAELSVRNRVDAVQSHPVAVQLTGRDELPVEPFGRLHAQLQVRQHPEQGERFVVADIPGPGKYVGTMMMMRGRPHEQVPFVFPEALPLNFLEGDDLLVVDGQTYHGTGTEESFGGGWYFSEGRFERPLSALLHIMQGEDDSGEITAVRWNLLSDAISFQERFSLSYEYGANHPQTAEEYRAVGLYYH